MENKSVLGFKELWASTVEKILQVKFIKKISIFSKKSSKNA